MKKVLTTIAVFLLMTASAWGASLSSRTQALAGAKGNNATQESPAVQRVPAKIFEASSHGGSITTTSGSLPSEAGKEVQDIQDQSVAEWSSFFFDSETFLFFDNSTVPLLRRDSERCGQACEPKGIHKSKQRPLLRILQPHEGSLLGTNVFRACRQDSGTSRLACAIANAEGFFKKGTLPNRLNNPGDIKSHSAHAYPGQKGLYHGYVIFNTSAAGWMALLNQLDKVIEGHSAHYDVNMTLRQFSKRYATSPTWIRNVSRTLGVSPEMCLWEILDVPPALELRWLYA